MSQGVMFIGTFNNPFAHQPDLVVQDYIEAWHTKAGAVYATGQLEKGESETPHIQFFIQFAKTNKKRVAALKKHCKFSHFELVKLNNGADEYCNKEQGRLDGPYTSGIKPARRNQKGDVARRNKELLDMGTVRAVEEGHIKLEDAPKLERALQMLRLLGKSAVEHSTVRGEWHWGVPGAGKSHTVRTTYPDAYIKQQNKWFDGYQGEKVIILEDLDTDTLSHHLKIWADKYSCTGETKGYQVPLMHEKLVITSNFSIEELFKDKGEITIEAIRRRFEIHHYPAKYGSVLPIGK